MHQPCGLVKQHMVPAQDLKLDVAHAEGGAALGRDLRKGAAGQFGNPDRQPRIGHCANPPRHRPDSGHLLEGGIEGLPDNARTVRLAEPDANIS